MTSSHLKAAIEQAMLVFHSDIETAHGNSAHLPDNPDGDQMKDAEGAGSKAKSLQAAFKDAKSRLESGLHAALPNNNVENLMGGKDTSQTKLNLHPEELF